MTVGELIFVIMFLAQALNYINPRPYRGGWCNPPPLRFFADSEKTAARSAAGFWATLWGKPSAIFGKKKFDRVRSGHGAMTS